MERTRPEADQVSSGLKGPSSRLGRDIIGLNGAVSCIGFGIPLREREGMPPAQRSPSLVIPPQLAASWAPLPIFPPRRFLRRRPAGGTSSLRSVPCPGSPASCISCCNTSASLSTADGGGSGEQPERCFRLVFFWSRRCRANTGAISLCIHRETQVPSGMAKRYAHWTN
jgi:hypothetical protein